MQIKLSYKHNEIIVFIFFIMLLIIYGRSIHFDVVADENGQSVVETVSKAPFLIGTTVLFFMLASKREKFNIRHIVNYKMWVLFFFILFVLIFFRGNLSGDVKNFGTIVFSYLMFFFLMKIVYKVPHDRLEDVFIYISFAIALLCVLFHYVQGHKLVFFPDRSDDNFDRLGGLFYYAHTAAIVGITSLFSLKKYINKRKLKYLLISVISLLLLVATDTRSAWFSVVFSIAFIIFGNVKFYKILVVALLAYFGSGFISEIMSSKSSIDNVDEDAEYRTMIWGYSLNVASENLITGYGDVNPLVNNFEANEKLRDPHNSSIHLLLQSGLIALSIYIFIFVSNCIKCLSYFDNSYRFLFFYWGFFSFFWGGLFNHLSGFIQIYLLFTIYAFALNPNSVVKNIITYTKNVQRA